MSSGSAVLISYLLSIREQDVVQAKFFSFLRHFLKLQINSSSTAIVPGKQLAHTRNVVFPNFHLEVRTTKITEIERSAVFYEMYKIGLSIVCGWTAGISPRIKLKLIMLCNSSLLDVVYGT